MSLLQDNSQQKTRAQEIADSIRRGAIALPERIIHDWSMGWEDMWGDMNSNTSKADILEALGTDAGELFELNDKLVSFLITLYTGVNQNKVDYILSLVASKPATTIHPNGTVTLDEEEVLPSEPSLDDEPSLDEPPIAEPV